MSLCAHKNKKTSFTRPNAHSRFFANRSTHVFDGKKSLAEIRRARCKFNAQAGTVANEAIMIFTHGKSHEIFFLFIFVLFDNIDVLQKTLHSLFSSAMKWNAWSNWRSTRAGLNTALSKIIESPSRLVCADEKCLIAMLKLFWPDKSIHLRAVVSMWLSSHFSIWQTNYLLPDLPFLREFIFQNLQYPKSSISKIFKCSWSTVYFVAKCLSKITFCQRTVKEQEFLALSFSLRTEKVRNDVIFFTFCTIFFLSAIMTFFAKL